MHAMSNHRGYTLIELMVAVGLFSIIMLLASGAYLVMINVNRQVQNTATGIDNLSFALDTMTRTIRTGSGYAGSGSTFSFVDASGNTDMYSLSSNELEQKVGSQISWLTDSSAVTVTALTFYVSGVKGSSQNYVTITISGTVSAGAGKTPQSFTIETSAAMRGSNI
jgi:prepilin-type N-terminal cleavage/methylation domain-containing protein